MTEQAWLNGREPEWLMAVLCERGLRDERKLTLAGSACFRRHWKAATDTALREAVEGAEQYVDQLLAPEELGRVHADAERLWKRLHAARDPQATSMVGYAAAATYLSGRVRDENALSNVMGAIVEGSRKKRVEVAAQLDLLRDVFGNPFRQVGFNPTWRTEAVVRLASGMYESRDFVPTPVLADALEDAGCTDPDILAHCRGSGPHARGC